MADRDRAERLREEARRCEEQAANRQAEAARKFSDQVDDMSEGIENLTSSIDATLEAINNATDLKSRNRELERLNDLMSSLESQTNTLRSGIQNLGSSMEEADREIAEITTSSAEQMLASLRDVVQEANNNSKEEAKQAEESLKEARDLARRTSDIYIMSQEKSRQTLIDSVNKEKEIREELESDVRKLLTTSNEWERKQLQKRIDKRRAQLSSLHSTIDRSMSYLDEIPEGMEDVVRDMHQSSEDLLETYDNIVDNIDETLNEDVMSKFKEFCDELRDVAMSLEVDAILSTLTDQVDGFIETRRQILARTGDSFDKESFSDAVSESMKDVDYTYSRNEMAAAYKDFIQSTRVQNLEVAKNYMTDIAAMQKAYGIGADSFKDLIRQDLNSKQDGAMVRSMSNIAASLENNGDLYTSADSILQEINNKAGLMYGIAQGDVKRQKNLLRSVAAIQAIQETANNEGITDMSEALKELQGLGTVYDYQDNEKANQLVQELGISHQELMTMVQNDPNQIYKMLGEKYQGMTDEEAYLKSQAYQGGIFGSSANIKAFAAYTSDEENMKKLDEVNKSIAAGDQAEGSLAVDKADALTSVTDKAGNMISDNPVVTILSDTLGELDINLANVAHAAMIAANAGTIFKGLRDGYQFLRGFFTTGAGAGFMSTVTSYASAALPAITSGLASLGTAFTTGISSLGSMLSSLGSSIASGISTFGPQVAKFALNPITLGVAGAVMAIKDAFDGYEKRTEWLGEERGNTTSGAVAATVGGAIGGTGPGLGHGDFSDVAGNVMSNVAKDAALGAAIGSIIPGVGTAIGGLIGAATGAVTGLIGGERIASTIKDAWDTIADFGEEAFTFAVDSIDSGIEGIQDFAQNLGPLGRSFGNVLEGQWNLLKDTGNEIMSIWDDPDRGILSKVGGTIITLAEVPFQAVGNVITGIKDGFTSFFEDLFDGVSDFFSSITEFFDFDIPFFGDDKDKKTSEAGSSSSSIPWFSSISSLSLIPGFAAGISEVPNDGIAYLHKGEAVLTEAQAVEARADGGIEVTEQENIGTAWQPNYSDFVLAEEVFKILNSAGGRFGYQNFSKEEDAIEALQFAGMSEGDIQIFMRNINSIARDMESMEYNSTKMNEGFYTYFKSEEEDKETNNKFQKALKRFFGLEASDGMAGTSGSGGSAFARMLQGLRGVFGGSSGGGGNRSADGGGNASSRRPSGNSSSSKKGKNGTATAPRAGTSSTTGSPGEVKAEYKITDDSSNFSRAADRATFMQDYGLEKYGIEIPTWFWRTILRSEGGAFENPHFNNPGGMDFNEDMAEKYGAVGEWFIDNGGQRHFGAKFPTLEEGLKAEVDWFLECYTGVAEGNQAIIDSYAKEIDAVLKGNGEEALRRHVATYVMGDIGGIADDYEWNARQGNYKGVFEEEFGDNSRTYDKIFTGKKGQPNLNTNPASAGGAKTYENVGREFNMRAQELYNNCTVTGISAMEEYYLGASDLYGDMFTEAWNTLLADRGGALNAKEYGFDTNEFDAFQQKLKETIDIGQTRPIGLYQTGGAGSAGDASFNNHSGNHFTVIKERTGEDTWILADPNGGTETEYTTEQLFDFTARGGSQGMAVGSGNALFIPDIEDPNVKVTEQVRDAITDLNSNITAQQNDFKFGLLGSPFMQQQSPKVFGDTTLMDIMHQQLPQPKPEPVEDLSILDRLKNILFGTAEASTPSTVTPNTPGQPVEGGVEMNYAAQISQMDTSLQTIASNVDGNVNVHEVVDAISAAVATLAGRLDAVVSAIGSINIQVNAAVAGAGGSGEPKDVMNSNTGFIYSL